MPTKVPTGQLSEFNINYEKINNMDFYWVYRSRPDYNQTGAILKKKSTIISLKHIKIQTNIQTNNEFVLLFLKVFWATLFSVGVISFLTL